MEIIQEQYKQLESLQDVKNHVLSRFLPLYYNDCRIVSDIVQILNKLNSLHNGKRLDIPHFNGHYVQCYVFTDGYYHENYQYFLWEE